MIALCQIRALPHYRRDAFEVGLRKAGYRLVNSGRPGGPEDLLITWNRYGAVESMADTWESCGGTVLVCENGYAGRDSEGRQYYAIAAHGHNGSGWWPRGTEDRWAALNIPLQPWREETADGHILVCGQRGIGSREMASPTGWHDQVAARIRKRTDRVVRIRPHPGNQPAKVPLEDDLAGAWACVIWSSGSGVKALVSGVPVYFDAPHWICELAAFPVGEWLTGPSPLTLQSNESDYRPQSLNAMAWAQWSVDEIQAGEPFARFLEATKTRAAA